jgi:hypothetical protein
LGAPRGVVELAERFDRNVEAYRAGRINEENTKVSYINPLLEALGWDVRNARGRPGGYQDVVFEDSVKIGGGTKAPDYGFYLGGARKFFLEAKKPSVNLADDVSPAVQLRRYAWTARHPVGILTDFEELAVYDCRIEPGKDDQPATARALYLRYDEYEDRWDELAELFGRDAVGAGSLERFAETAKTRRGTETVDRAFLREIEGWRQTLAKDLARRNQINGRQLNFAVQTTIDRIIFLRMAEDRGIEEYGRLLALTNGPNVYGRMLGMFREADDRYNSGLFHFRSERGRLEEPDDLTPHLSIGDDALAGIIRGLYYPECPYEFSVLPVDVLGQVYEQFLGSVIRLDSPDSAVVEAKPEVRKAGGVYYTPTYIVDYIVQNTLGKLLEGKRPGPRGGVSRLKIVDPACGSGSFLIGAYEYLLDWHRDRYVEDGPEKHQKRVYEGPGGKWLLTIDEKKRILVNNIHGVDIDPQAVEVTKLSLLLKVLEGETDESITRQLSLFAAERALPDLDANIKCGNSLIGPDFYDQQDLTLFGDEDFYRINVFDWESSFPHVFGGEDSGFDAVIGNPPYIRMEAFKELKSYLRSEFASHAERSDLYSYFVERGHKILRIDGMFGMILSNKFLRANYGKPLRNFLSHNSTIERIVDFAGLPVFANATVRTLVLLTRRDTQVKEPTIYSPPLNDEKFLAVRTGTLSISAAIEESAYEVPPESLAVSAWSFIRSDVSAVLSKLKQSFQPLAEYCEGQICMGVKSGLTEAFVIDGQIKTEILKKNPEAEKIIKPFLGGRDVRRYWLEKKDAHLLYTYHGVNVTEYPAVEEHLKQFRDRLEKRATKSLRQ